MMGLEQTKFCLNRGGGEGSGGGKEIVLERTRLRCWFWEEGKDGGV
jgi:hypothetical protein